MLHSSGIPLPIAYMYVYQNLEKKKVDILSYIFPDNVTIKE